jgi:hypothetical protein
MDRFSREELTDLLAQRDGHHVSIFLPTVRAGAEVQQNAIRFKNLLREASTRLQERGVERPEAEELLAPARALLGDYDFWQHQEDGLAVFLAGDFLRTYRLPVAFRELAVVEDRFHLKSLFALFNEEGRFFILAVSQNDVRLLAADPREVHEVPLVDVPRSLEDALGHEVTQQALQIHLGARNTNRPRSARIFHGHGGGEEDVKEEIRKFLNAVDQGIRRHLPDDDRSPLVLAGVEYLLPIYRDVSDYPNVLSDGVHGNPDELRPEELHERAWPLVEKHLRGRREEDAERFGELAGTGRASSQLEEVVPAAMDGRVEILFVPRGVRQWGRFDPATRAVERHAEQNGGSEDLLDRATVHTFLNGGRVYSLPPGEVPGGGPVAATFRW